MIPKWYKALERKILVQGIGKEKYWYNGIGMEIPIKIRRHNNNQQNYMIGLYFWERKHVQNISRYLMKELGCGAWYGMVQNSKFPTDSVQHAWHTRMNTFYMLLPTKLLLNGFQSLVTTVVQVVNFIANTAAPALAAHHVEAWFSWNTPAWSACQSLLDITIYKN